MPLALSYMTHSHLVFASDVTGKWVCGVLIRPVISCDIFVGYVLEVSKENWCIYIPFLLCSNKNCL